MSVIIPVLLSLSTSHPPTMPNQHHDKGMYISHDPAMNGTNDFGNKIPKVKYPKNEKVPYNPNWSNEYELTCSREHVEYCKDGINSIGEGAP